MPICWTTSCKPRVTPVPRPVHLGPTLEPRQPTQAPPSLLRAAPVPRPGPLPARSALSIQAPPRPPRVAPSSLKPRLQSPVPIHSKFCPRYRPIAVPTSSAFPSAPSTTPQPVPPCFSRKSPSRLRRGRSSAAWCSPLGGGVGLRTARACLHVEGSLLQTPPHRFAFRSLSRAAQKPPQPWFTVIQEPRSITS